MEGSWKIWVEFYDDEGRKVGAGHYAKEYANKTWAERVAKERFGDPKKFKYWVSQTNPWTKEG